jgi:hypothetical protein
MNMRLLKYFSATIAALFAGWLLSGVLPWLLGFFGGALANRIRELSPRLISYLLLGFALPFFSAWLVSPDYTNTLTGQSGLHARHREYLVRLPYWIALAVLFAFVLPVVEMVLLDAGLI